MTIADNLTALAEQKLGYQDSVEACKVSLENKDVVVPAGSKLADISGLIDEIQQGGGDPSIPVGVGQWLVTFYDFNGKVLKRQRVNTGESATAPAIPTHEFLTFAEWNNPFTNVQSDIDTGAIYNTTDGCTYLFYTITAVTGLAPTLYFSKSSTSLMTITRNDGTTWTSTTAGNQTLTLNHATAGDYWIKVDNSAGGTWQIGQGAAATKLFNGYESILTKIYIGNFTNLSGSAFHSNSGLKYTSFGSYLSTFNYVSIFQQCRNYEFFIANANATTFGYTAFYECSTLKKIISKNHISFNGGANLWNCYGLKKMIFATSKIAIQNTEFLGCSNITVYIFNSTTPPTLANINAFSGINPICKIYVPDASVNAYKTATNWVTYANYIYPLSQKPQSDE